MTTAKIFAYKSNLARKMAVPGGRSVEDALARAEAGLEGHRTTVMKTLHAHVAALERLCETRDGNTSAVYENAAALLDLAGFIQTGPLYKAAYSLCELAHRMGEAQTWSWPSVAVHVQALRLILAENCRETDETARVLIGLATILKLFPAKSG